MFLLWSRCTFNLIWKLCAPPPLKVNAVKECLLVCTTPANSFICCLTISGSLFINTILKKSSNQTSSSVSLISFSNSARVRSMWEKKEKKGVSSYRKNTQKSVVCELGITFYFARRNIVCHKSNRILNRNCTIDALSRPSKGIHCNFNR